MVHPRRTLAVVLVIAAVAMIAISVVSAADVGYHVDQGHLMLPEQHQGHVYLHILGDPPELGISVALAMLVAAGYFGTVRRGVRIWGAIAAGAAGVLLLLSSCADVMTQSTLGESGGSTAATSVQYKVVQYEQSGLTASDDVVLHLRSRRGLLSYEGSSPVACFIDDSSGAGAEWLFDHASLTGDDIVQVVAKDGTTWEVRFDPHTLRPANPVDRCTEAPDPVGAD